MWETEKTHEAKPLPGQAKYFITFPFPYMNGKLHLGHVYSFTKCDFTARYKRLRGFNVLLPFAFHCTGQPIGAAALKLKNELGMHSVQIQELYGDPPNCPEGKVSPQYNIMKMLGIPSTEIKKFIQPVYWFHYFPPLAQKDLTKFGAAVDFRRSFITTDANPYFDSFVQWQYQWMHKHNLVRFGIRPTIFSPKDNQPIADHERSAGEGVVPQEFTLIKIRVLALNQSLESFNGKNVFLVATTLRPETMYGQTNVYLKPDGVYGAYETVNGDIFICSQQSANNMAWQDIFPTKGVAEPIKTFTGADLMGLPVFAPLCTYEQIYTLPQFSIDMNIGTGVVTSVPSDSPDDFVAFRDLQNKEALRKKFNISDDMIFPFKAQPIIDVVDYGTCMAQKICEELNIKGQNDSEKLKTAKEIAYTKGFYKGILQVGEFKGMKVIEAKPLIRKNLIAAGDACAYFEPEKPVITRSGDICVVALCDQWYIIYDDEQWKQKVRQHLETAFKTIDEPTLQLFKGTVDWIQSWGVSRTFGLGSRLPFDRKYLIESLSDSTIYYAYYTVSHKLHSDLNGQIIGSSGIKAEQMTKEVWDYILLNGDYQDTFGISQEILNDLRTEFQYWYPLDLRCSAKDLVQNHLTKSLFDHAAIWPDQPEFWPRSFFVNGYINVDNQKMAKSLGNFFTLEEILEKFGADATRFAMADAGDTVDDANFTLRTTDDAVLKLFQLETWIKQLTLPETDAKSSSEAQSQSHKFFHDAFSNQIKQLHKATVEAYEKMRFRDVLKYGFHEFVAKKDEYISKVGKEHANKDLILQWISLILTQMYPIIPHITEYVYLNYFLKLVDRKQEYPERLSAFRFSEDQTKDIDILSIQKYDFFARVLRGIRLARQKAVNAKKGKKGLSEEPEFVKVIIVIADDYQEWQKVVISVIAQHEYFNDAQRWKQEIKNMDAPQELKTRQIQFGQYVLDNLAETNQSIDDLDVPFDQSAVLKELNHYLIEAANVTTVEVICLLIPKIIGLAECDPKLMNKQQAVIPGRPAIIFV